MIITEFDGVYNLKIVKFLLFRSPSDLKKLTECAKLIIEDGIGSAHLDKITPKSFLDRGDDYYSRVCDEVKNNSLNVEYLFQALIEWFVSWSGEFDDFTEESSRCFYEKNKLKTWTYCILNGKPELFIRLSDETPTVLSGVEMESLEYARIHSKEQTFLAATKFSKDASINLFNESLQKEMQEMDERKRTEAFINTIKERRVLVLTKDTWSVEILETIRCKYHLHSVLQLSAMEYPRGVGKYDYIIFCATHAKHSVWEFIESNFKKSKIILVNSQNPDKVFNEFRFQLMGG